MKRTYVMPLLVLTVICIVVSAALALMNSVTHPIIASAENERAEAAMSKKLPAATGFEQISTESFDNMPSAVSEIYRATNDVGYIFIAVVGGFSGDITVICAIDTDGNIIATSTLSHTETQGIGTIIEQASFLDTFTGTDHRLEGIDTVTGATISTRAYINAITDILNAYEIIRKG